MVELELRVVKAKKLDIGRSIVRISGAVMKNLQIKTGDIVSIKGKKETTSIAWPAYPEDKDKLNIRMDHRARENAKVQVGEKIKIRKANYGKAISITLAPISSDIRSSSEVNNYIKRKLINNPLIKGDKIIISIAINRELHFKIISTKPSGIVLVKNSTNLKILNKKHDIKSLEIFYKTFDDIGGLKKEIKILRKIFELPQIHPELFKYLKIKNSNGILLYGPPGCGKTLLVQAIANECKYYLISLNGAEIFSKYIEESKKRLNEIFDKAKNHSPSIIHISNLSSIAPKFEVSSSLLLKLITSELIYQLDNLAPHSNIIVIGEDTKLEDVSPLLCLPRRLDTHIKIEKPDKDGRLEILKIYLKDLDLSDDVNLNELVSRTEDFTGARIAKLCNEAIRNSIDRYFPDILNRKEPFSKSELNEIKLTMEDFIKAL
ncbi:MAG: AAA family ATPase [Candidatus Lokiarchaeota archaeon]|nr:AAA family ATPase [Candidatus Lokiarchaeota archaeon]